MLVARHSKPESPGDRQQKFTVQGVVRSVAAAGQTVVIQHEDIPGLMPSMTMPFKVKDVTLLQGLASGDRVSFELVVTKDDSWISRLERTERSAGQPAPGAERSASAVTTDGASRELRLGDLMPDFSLTDQNGRPFRLADHRGQAVLITFVYTRCPLPNYCPLMSRNFADLQQRFSKAFPGRFHLLTVSFDPAYDTPEVLKRYAAAFRHEETTWTFATGAPQQIEALTSALGLVYLPEGGLITHDLRTALIAPDGRLVQVWRSNVWTPYEVQRAVAEVLQPVHAKTPLASLAAAPSATSAVR